MNQSAARKGSMNTIESSVTRLLVATKHLLESLTQWAKGAATESEVSDAYVQLGGDFKVACRAFSNTGVDVADLGDVPHLLRVVLEEALCEPPSQQSLDRYLPTIRQIIVNLLRNLKKKQNAVREMNSQIINHNTQRASSAPVRKSLMQQQQQSKPLPQVDHHNHTHHQSATPARASTLGSNASAQLKQRLDLYRALREGSASVNEESDQPAVLPAALPSINVEVSDGFQSGEESDALKQLQNGDSLKRRASRRFSAYQYAKLTKQTEMPLPKDSTQPPQTTALTVENNNNNEEVDDNPENLTAQQPQQSQQPRMSVHESSTSNGTTVYLKINNRTKKVDVQLPVTFSSLRLLFIEKFAYSPGSDSFPEIYIQESITDVPYELEEHLLPDVKGGSILSLNAQEHSIEIIKDLETKVSTLQTQLSKIQDNIKETIRETILSIPPPAPAPALIDNKTKGRGFSKSLDDLDISDIRRELMVIKQISSGNKQDFASSIKSLLEKVQEFKSSGFEAPRSANRNYMEKCHSKLSEDSDELLTKVDDLQDVIEALRKDVAQRGAKPSEDQLVGVKKDIDSAQNSIDVMHEYIVKEKPNWKAIWEKELDVVCEEQQFFKLQEDLVDDLREDLEKAFETFTLVEHVSKEHQKNKGGRIRQPNLPLVEPGTSLVTVRGAMLSEVSALKPNHEKRVNAIEKAEKVREKEKQTRLKNEFEEELGGFVEGKKLKKSGGIEETERLRKKKDEENLKASFAVF